MNRENELGALWLKTGQATGKKFMSGKLTIDDQVVEVVVFRNEYKEPGDSKPDYRVYRSQQRDSQPQSQPKTLAEDLDDDIPF